ncbi:MAG: hypothetical protein ABI184_07830 [Ginsengibacter sp.]
MWIWWVISLIVLIACFIFAYRMIVSSFDYLPEGKKHLFIFGHNATAEKSSANSAKEEIIWDLKNQLKKVEENASFYDIQFSKLQQRLKTLEVQQINQQQNNSKFEDEENWKELYYEENEVKEKLENELDIAQQKLTKAENKLNSIVENKISSVALQSEYDARLNDILSMQDYIGTLQRKIEASAERERELEQLLIAENHIKNQYEQLKHDYTRLQIENEDLRKQIVEMDKRERDVEINIVKLNDLERKLSAYEEEKSIMIATLEKIVQQKKTFAS